VVNTDTKTINDLVNDIKLQPISDYLLSKRHVIHAYDVGHEFSVYAWDTYRLLFRKDKDGKLVYDSHYNSAR
jgi:hypothetical protein